jgi:nucleotide-binding universal stress UspA family protein
MYKRILLAYDGSEAGRTALLECRDLVAMSRSEIHLIAVVQPIPAAVLYEVVISDVPDSGEETEHQQRVLDEGVALLRERGFPAQGHLARGEPVEQITEAARRLQADLIIVGHRRPKGWADRWWRGSIGASLMDATHCSVLIAMNACSSGVSSEMAA